MTTDRKRGDLVYPNLAGDILPTGPDQLRVADLTYIRLQKEFELVYAKTEGRIPEPCLST